MVADSAGLGNSGLRAKGMSGSGPSFHYGECLSLAALGHFAMSAFDPEATKNPLHNRRSGPSEQTFQLAEDPVIVRSKVGAAVGSPRLHGCI